MPLPVRSAKPKASRGSPGLRQRPLDGRVEPACIRAPRLQHHADEVEPPARRANTVTPAACHRDAAAGVGPSTGWGSARLALSELSSCLGARWCARTGPGEPPRLPTDITENLPRRFAYRAQLIDLYGVPYRIRTGVAAVRGGQRDNFGTSADSCGQPISLITVIIQSTSIHPCPATSLPYNCRTF
jgi:hypothetical protein